MHKSAHFRGECFQKLPEAFGVSLKFHLGQGPSCHPPCGGTAEGTALPGILVLFRENPVVPQLGLRAVVPLPGRCWAPRAHAATTGRLHGHRMRGWNRPPLQMKTPGPVTGDIDPRTSCLIYCKKDILMVTKQKMAPLRPELWTGFWGLGCLSHEA